MTQPLLQATDLVKTYGNGHKAVDGVSLEVSAGEIVGVVGESGSGKSTTGRMILGLLKPDSGSVRFDGADIHSMSRARLHELRARMQVVPQNPQTSLNPRLTIGASMEFNMRVHGIARAERQQRVSDLLGRVGMAPTYARRYPHQMSGGQLQRVAIARALATEPQLVVCDEAVSALDKSVQAQVLNLIADLQRDMNVAFVFISHDLAVVEHISDNVVVMNHGKVVEYGSAEQVWSNPQDEYTARLLSAIPGKSLMAS
ncbi:ATP-binding cassette domain-containing protein [Gordonia sp. i37]|uniref:ATP-binding cassette domain-containing protein n=1 Tax=Gordonia sp. i37 TaxID=1961707 RepID=UPI0009ADC428|nr:ATP-binding cassette domain-containing protein [Gordonia sp. i37]OPX14937.1 peptide ABC transporter ATP-binding protein [Gordonia sp. i37]